MVALVVPSFCSSSHISISTLLEGDGFLLNVAVGFGRVFLPTSASIVIRDGHHQPYASSSSSSSSSWHFFVNTRRRGLLTFSSPQSPSKNQIFWLLMMLIFW
jgi:hypothetical protein